MKIYDVYVEQTHVDKGTIRAKNYQVVACDLSQAIFCAGQRFHDNADWVTQELMVRSLNGEECYQTTFEGWE